MPRSFPRGLHCRAEGLCWNASWNQYEPIDIVCQAAAGKIGAAIRGSSTRWQAEWILFADACGKFFWLNVLEMNKNYCTHPPDFFPSRKNANTDLYFILAAVRVSFLKSR